MISVLVKLSSNIELNIPKIRIANKDFNIISPIKIEEDWPRPVSPPICATTRPGCLVQDYQEQVP